MRKNHYNSFGDKVVSALINVVIAVMALSCLLPLMHTISQSFSSATAVDAGWVTFWPVQPTLKAYRELLHEKAFFVAFGVSVARVVVGTAISLLFTVIMAYPMSKEDKAFPQRKFYLIIFLIGMLFSGGMIPTYLTLKSYSLLDTFAVLVLPGAVNTGNVILMMNFFRGIPHELEEAAIIDGAGPIRTLKDVYLPISLPSLATITLFCSVSYWNEYFSGILYINTPSLRPLQSYIQQFTVDIDMTRGRSYEELMKLMQLNNRTLNAAKLFVGIVPILCVYPFLQKYFTTGLVIGAVKG